MFDVLPKGQPEAVRMAQDSAFTKYDGAFKGLNNIRKA
jgi:hypothetical protein